MYILPMSPKSSHWLIMKFSFAYLNQESHLSQMKYTGIDLKEDHV